MQKTAVFSGPCLLKPSSPLVLHSQTQMSQLCLVQTDGKVLLLVPPPPPRDFWSEEETRMCFLCPADGCHSSGALALGPILHSGLGLAGRCV